MSQLPKRLRVLWDWWTVRVSKVDIDDAECLGKTTPYDRTIDLYTNPHEERPARGPLQQTLLHEVLHAALATSAVSALLSDGQEEVLVTQLEVALWPLIQQGVFKESE